MELEILNLGKMDYGKALDIQQNILAARQEGKLPDMLILVEHFPVITLGRRGRYENIFAPEQELEEAGVKIYEVNRGGDVTYHGPGQLVGYPIVDLNNHGKDIRQFVWNIEEVFIRLLLDEFGIKARREEGTYTGVWVGNNKITAIGIAVKRWVTMHGFAFNINTNLGHFKWINPCGLSDRGVTSLEELLGARQDFRRVTGLVTRYFSSVFGYKNVREAVPLEQET